MPVLQVRPGVGQFGIGIFCVTPWAAGKYPTFLRHLFKVLFFRKKNQLKDFVEFALPGVAPWIRLFCPGLGNFHSAFTGFNLQILQYRYFCLWIDESQCIRLYPATSVQLEVDFGLSNKSCKSLLLGFCTYSCDDRFLIQRTVISLSKGYSKQRDIQI